MPPKKQTPTARQAVRSKEVVVESEEEQDQETNGSEINESGADGTGQESEQELDEELEEEELEEELEEEQDLQEVDAGKNKIEEDEHKYNKETHKAGLSFNVNPYSKWMKGYIQEHFGMKFQIRKVNICFAAANQIIIKQLLSDAAKYNIEKQNGLLSLDGSTLMLYISSDPTWESIFGRYLSRYNPTFSYINQLCVNQDDLEDYITKKIMLNSNFEFTSSCKNVLYYLISSLNYNLLNLVTECSKRYNKTVLSFTGFSISLIAYTAGDIQTILLQKIKELHNLFHSKQQKVDTPDGDDGQEIPPKQSSTKQSTTKQSATKQSTPKQSATKQSTTQSPTKQSSTQKQVTQLINMQEDTKQEVQLRRKTDTTQIKKEPQKRTAKK